MGRSSSHKKSKGCVRRGKKTKRKKKNDKKKKSENHAFPSVCGLYDSIILSFQQKLVRKSFSGIRVYSNITFPFLSVKLSAKTECYENVEEGIFFSISANYFPPEIFSRNKLFWKKSNPEKTIAGYFFPLPN